MAFRGRNMLIKVSAEERYFETVSIDSPIAYYRLGELAGTVAVDEIELQNGIYELSPNLGVNGLLSNDPNKAVSMDGSTVDHNVNLTNTSNFSFPSAPFSLEAFIALDNMTNKNPIISKVDVDGNFLNNEFLFQVRENGVLQVFIYQGSGINQHIWSTAPGAISASTTYHVVATYDGSINSGKLYIDGVAASITYSIGGSFTNIVTTNATTRIGARFVNDGSLRAFLDGTIDEVAIYDYVLTSEQVFNHYCSGSGECLDIIGGLQAKTFTLNRELVDITTFPTSIVSVLWRKLLPNMNSALSISGTCIFKDDAGINLISSLADNGELGEFELEFENGDTITGNLAVTNLGQSGEYLDAQKTDMTLESSGNITLNRVSP